jgi:hypothetical protein
MHHSERPQMFRLTRRKASSLWQVRKRWPADVATFMAGEFTRSTGEADRKRAQAVLPVLAAEYERRVQEARDRLADSSQRDLTRAEMHWLAAKLYGDLLPLYALKRPIEASRQASLLADLKGDLNHLTASLALLWQIVGEPSSPSPMAVVASWRWRLAELCQDRLPDGRQGRLRRWAGASFFSDPQP